METKKYKVAIFGGTDLYREACDIWWGEGSEEEKREFIESHREEGMLVREFDTAAERQAYLKGIDDSEGWLDVFVLPAESHKYL